MVRRVIRRLGVAIAALAVALVSPLAGTAAYAAPTPPPPPAGVSITGDGIATPLTIRADADAVRFGAVMEQVNWLSGPGQTNALSAEDLGPKYTVVVLAGETPKQTYDLYPLAKGGPRACRPAKQPDSRKNSSGPAWFFGRLSMTEALLAAGVPLPQQDGVPVSGGIGGGAKAIPDAPTKPSEDLDNVLTDLRRLLLLNTGVILLITLGLAGISLLVRRRTR
ncbi:hypothetical protein AB0J86_37625 [Micromonospora sp. NPDC049559]|uniref:hypothetical protein n=1 Tax=Micromonospora sp. NPDC049559 TaxID=3155923 RepID=UPI0034282D85